MKKFRFNLESVLKVRQREEKNKLRILAAVQSRINVYHNNNLKMEEDYKLEEMQYLERMKTNFRAEESWLFDRYIKRIAEQKRQNLLEIEKLQPLLLEAKKNYEEAYRQKKAVEVLKEKRWEEYKKALLKEEQEESDEISARVLLRREQERKKLSNTEKYSKPSSLTEKNSNDESELDMQENKDEQLLELYEMMKKSTKANSFEGFKKRYNL